MAVFFNKKIRKSCAFCIYGTASRYTAEIFCSKKGVVLSDSVCRKYKYDVLKRKPENELIASNFTPSDFKL